MVTGELDNLYLFNSDLPQALIDLCQKVSKGHQVRQGQARSGSEITAGQGGIAGSQEKPFDTMNNIVANLLLNLTRLAD